MGNVQELQKMVEETPKETCTLVLKSIRPLTERDFILHVGVLKEQMRDGETFWLSTPGANSCNAKAAYKAEGVVKSGPSDVSKIRGIREQAEIEGLGSLGIEPGKDFEVNGIKFIYVGDNEAVSVRLGKTAYKEYGKVAGIPARVKGLNSYEESDLKRAADRYNEEHGLVPWEEVEISYEARERIQAPDQPEKYIPVGNGDETPGKLAASVEDMEPAKGSRMESCISVLGDVAEAAIELEDDGLVI